MITEVYVPRRAFPAFMRAAAASVRRHDARITYGTVRLIERDNATFLPWARDDFACIVLNVLTAHTDEGIASSRILCRTLIDLALERGGSFFLTYHRWARADQVRHAYPGIDAFIDAKRRHDPRERFTSEWFRALTQILGRCRGEPTTNTGVFAGRAGAET